MKKEIFKVIKIILIIIAFLLLNDLMIKSDEDFVKGCMENGNSYNYCISHK